MAYIRKYLFLYRLHILLRGQVGGWLRGTSGCRGSHNNLWLWSTQAHVHPLYLLLNSGHCEASFGQVGRLQLHPGQLALLPGQLVVAPVPGAWKEMCWRLGMWLRLRLLLLHSLGI